MGLLLGRSKFQTLVLDLGCYTLVLTFFWFLLFTLLFSLLKYWNTEFLSWIVQNTVMDLILADKIGMYNSFYGMLLSCASFRVVILERLLEIENFVSKLNFFIIFLLLCE